MKIPAAFTLRNRAASLAQDAKLLNGYVGIKRNRRDPRKIDKIYASKRPALTAAYTLTSGTGQALYVPATPANDGIPAAVIGDILNRAMTTQKSKLIFGVEPSNVALNTSISPSITVNIEDVFGNIVSVTDNVTLSLLDNPSGATLGGTLTKAAVGGVATFNNITLNRSGQNFTLLATASGLNPDISTPFTIATHLSFTTQPSSTAPNDPIVCAVSALDKSGGVDTTYNGNITVSIYAGTGTLSGTKTVQAVAGVAAFADLSIDTAGTFFLSANGESISNAYPPSNAVSNSFTITNPHILNAALIPDPPFGNIYGFIISTGGSISPTTFGGAQIRQLNSQDNGTLTIFELDGILSQNFFTSITINGTTTLLSSAASFSTGGGTSDWIWNGMAFNAAGIYDVLIL